MFTELREVWLPIQIASKVSKKPSGSAHRWSGSDAISGAGREGGGAGRPLSAPGA
jgi:hypothetical protein